MNNVFVYCEIEGTAVAEVSQELLTKGRKLANQLGVELNAVVAGTGIIRTAYIYPGKSVQGRTAADLPHGSNRNRPRPRSARIVISHKRTHRRLHTARDWRLRRQEDRQAL